MVSDGSDLEEITPLDISSNSSTMVTALYHQLLLGRPEHMPE